MHDEDLDTSLTEEDVPYVKEALELMLDTDMETLVQSGMPVLVYRYPAGDHSIRIHVVAEVEKCEVH